ncbi:hypothetical protein ACH50O_15325 [Methylomonas sp. 2BW1-5-20]|uniref:hypothetical protein n=1 Tax=Methylomonas sp. 2BW1-5-20 TaxID=3376686 RepID=UPI00404D1540
MSEVPGIVDGKLLAKFAASNLLTISAGVASSSLDKLATWFLVAFGAGIALILSNLKDISEFIPIPVIACVSTLFFWASVLCFAQRYVATVIGCGAASAKESRELIEKLARIDPVELIAQMKAGIPYLLRLIASGLLNAVENGDFAAVGKLFIRLTLFQGLLATSEVIVLLVALSKLAIEVNAIPG